MAYGDVVMVGYRERGVGVVLAIGLALGATSAILAITVANLVPALVTAVVGVVAGGIGFAATRTSGHVTDRLLVADAMFLFAYGTVGLVVMGPLAAIAGGLTGAVCLWARAERSRSTTPRHASTGVGGAARIVSGVAAVLSAGLAVWYWAATNGPLVTQSLLVATTLTIAGIAIVGVRLVAVGFTSAGATFLILVGMGSLTTFGLAAVATGSVGVAAVVLALNAGLRQQFGRAVTVAIVGGLAAVGALLLAIAGPS